MISARPRILIKVTILKKSCVGSVGQYVFYIKVGYNLDVMRQSACLVLNPITFYSYGFLLNCTTVGQASDSDRWLGLLSVFSGDGSVVVDFLFCIPIVGFCNCSMFCCTLLYVPSSFPIILLGKRELVALFSLSSWCLVMVVWLFLAVPEVCLQFVIVVFTDHTHLLLLNAFQ